MDPELQKKLAEMLKNAALGPDAGKLKDFDPKALAEKGKGGTPDDFKAALDDMAERMGKGEKSAEGDSAKPGNPSDQAGEKGQSGAPSDEAQAKTAAQQAAAAQMSMQMVREVRQRGRRRQDDDGRRHDGRRLEARGRGQHR